MTIAITRADLDARGFRAAAGRTKDAAAGAAGGADHQQRFDLCPRARPGSVVYTVSKQTVTGLTRTLALVGRPFDIDYGQIDIDIGNAATDMTSRMSGGVAQADGSIKPEPTMDVQDVARAVLYMAGLHLSANVPFMTVLATKMPFLGRG